VRAAHVVEWLGTRRPDVLGLQELKLPSDEFPAAPLAEAGYHAAVHGQKTWNGVALVSREPLDEVQRGIPELSDDPQARILSARRGDVRLINVYVPNGETVESQKYAYKLRWLEALARHLDESHDPGAPLAIFGDFNIAPEDLDIYDPVAFQNRVLFSEPEHAALQRLFDWGLTDLFRRFHTEERSYSWWDYRQAAFRRNLGARIDLILVTRPLAERAVSCEIDMEPRTREKPSDHTPVVAVFS
jgi:exodeoxyribonuclease-3